MPSFARKTTKKKAGTKGQKRPEYQLTRGYPYYKKKICYEMEFWFQSERKCFWLKTDVQFEGISLFKHYLFNCNIKPTSNLLGSFSNLLIKIKLPAVPLHNSHSRHFVQRLEESPVPWQHDWEHSANAIPQHRLQMPHSFKKLHYLEVGPQNRSIVPRPTPSNIQLLQPH